jgi:hypothetical protein
VLAFGNLLVQLFDGGCKFSGPFSHLLLPLRPVSARKYRKNKRPFLLIRKVLLGE